MNWKKLLVISCVAVTLIGLYLGNLAWEEWKESQETAFVSCMASINSSLDNLEASETSGFNESDDWLFLEEKKSEEFLKKIKVADCKGTTASNLFDPWGNKILVAYKHTKLGIFFLVWTSGRDKISGNEDDLVYPVGTKTISK